MYRLILKSLIALMFLFVFKMYNWQRWMSSVHWKSFRKCIHAYDLLNGIFIYTYMYLNLF